MPQLQVIDRQPTDTAPQAAAAIGDIGEMLQKKQAMELAKRQYDLQAKQSESQIEQMRFKQKSDELGFLSDISKADPSMRPAMIKMYINTFHRGNAQGGLKSLAEHGDEVQKILETMQGSTEMEKAELASKQAKAAEAQGLADLYKQALPQQGTQANPNQGAVNALNGAGAQSTPYGQAPVIKEIGPNGPTITFPGVERMLKEQGAEATAQGAATGNRNVALKDFTKDLETFEAVGDQLHRPSSGGFMGIKTGIQKLINGATALNADSPEAVLLRTYAGARSRMIVAVARIKDVGNLSEPEQKAAALIMPSAEASYPEYKLKVAYMKDIGRAIDSNKPSEVKKIIQSWMNTDTFKKEQRGISRQEALGASDTSSSAVPNGAAFFSKSTGKYYDASGKEL